jgi:serine O-acetyltransferase
MISARFIPVFLCRMAMKCNSLGLRSLAKLFSLMNFFFFGIEIAVACRIGPGLFLPHTQGTVIGAWSVGKNATIFQGVTLGAREIDFEPSQQTRPTVEDDVSIGAGAKVLGGIRLGQGCRVGANAVVLSSVPPQCMAVGVPARIIINDVS